MPSCLVRAPQPEDAFILALLVNGANEPHFHTTADKITQALEQRSGSRLVAEKSGQVVGTVSLSFPEFLPDNVWLGFSLHPDHRDHETASALLRHASTAALSRHRLHAWTSTRADYLNTLPELSALGFREVHRTFGGGFSFDAQTDWGAFHADPDGITLASASDRRHDPRLHHLYDRKQTRKPTLLRVGPGSPC